MSATFKQINFIHNLCEDLNISEQEQIYNSIGENKHREELTLIEAKNVIDDLLLIKYERSGEIS